MDSTAQVVPLWNNPALTQRVQNYNYRQIGPDPPVIYRPMLLPIAHVLVRTELDEPETAALLRSEVCAVDPNLVPEGLRSLDESISLSDIEAQQCEKARKSVTRASEALNMVGTKLLEFSITGRVFPRQIVVKG